MESHFCVRPLFTKPSSTKDKTSPMENVINTKPSASVLGSVEAQDSKPLYDSKGQSPSFLSHVREFQFGNKNSSNETLGTFAQSEHTASFSKENNYPKRKSSKSSENLTFSYPVVSPVDSPTEFISETLDLPTHKPYSEAVISHMLLLRIEQEKTKQTQDKIELGRIVAQLLKDSEDCGIGRQILRQLFFDESSNVSRSHFERLEKQCVLRSREISSSGEGSTSTHSAVNTLMSKVEGPSSCPQPSTRSPRHSTSTLPEPDLASEGKLENLPSSDRKSLHSALSMAISNLTDTHAIKLQCGSPREKVCLPQLKLEKDDQNMMTEIHSRAGSGVKCPNKLSLRAFSSSKSKSQTWPEPSSCFRPVIKHHNQIYGPYMPPPVTQTRQDTPDLKRTLSISHDCRAKSAFESNARYLRKVGVFTQGKFPQRVPSQLSQSMQRIDSELHQMGHRQMQPFFLANDSGSIQPQSFPPPPPLTTNCGMHSLLHSTEPPISQVRYHRLVEDTISHKKQRTSNNGIVFMISTPQNPPAHK